MSKDNNPEENMIPNDEDEVSAFSKEMRVKKESEEVSFEESPLSGKTKNYSKAKSLIKKAKKITDDANRRIEGCRSLFEDKLKAYKEVRSALQDDGFDSCVSLLRLLGHEIKSEEKEKPTEVFGTQKEVKPFRLKDISNGRITGLFYALVGGAVTAIGMVYLATQKLEMTLDVTKVPSENEIESILAWFSTLIGMQENVAIGAGVLGSIAMLVMIFIYVIHIRWKARSNLHLAVKQFVEAELYAEQKIDCKEKMEKVDAHMQDMIGTLKAYLVLLNEQKGKLERILYFEGEKEKGASYHQNSLAEIEDTKVMIEAVGGLIETPIVEDEEIREESIVSLQKAKEKLFTFIKRF